MNQNCGTLWAGCRAPLVALVGTVLASTLGCSTTATISRVNGAELDAHFAGSDAKFIYVKTESGAQVIPRSEVTDIDHPGDTAAVLGLIVGAYGVVNIGVAASQCNSNGAAYCTGVFLPAAIGLPMLLWGIVVHTDSTNELEQRVPDAGTAEAIRMKPGLFVAPNGQAGVGLEGQF